MKRDQLKEFINYDKDKGIREELKAKSEKEYKRKHSDKDCMDFIKENLVSIKVNHPQATNHPYYYTLFSVSTQFVMADSINELFDKAIDRVAAKEKTILK